MKLQKLRDIIPDIKNGLTYQQIADKYEVGSTVTVWRWVKKLQEAGITVKVERGRKRSLII
jgi:transposase